MLPLRLFQILFNRALKRKETREDLGLYSVFIFLLGFIAGALIVVLEMSLIAPRAGFKNTNAAAASNRQQKLHGILISNSTGSAQAKLLLKIENMQNLSTNWLSNKKQGTRILCWIMTTTNNHQTKAVHVKTTWGKKCDLLLFMSDGEDKTLPAINVKVGIGREFLWAKTVKALQYVHEHHENDYDWAIKADDDAFMLIDNVKKMVVSQNPAEKMYFGYRLKKRDQDSLNSYTSGGAGYITSRGSVKTFVEFHKTTRDFNVTTCPNGTDQGPEDVNLGVCFEHLNITLVDSRDKNGRQTFFPLNHDFTVFPAAGDHGVNWWYYSKSYWPVLNSARDTFSLRYVSNHYVTPLVMHEFHYLLYNIKHPLPVEQVGRLMKNTSFIDMTRPPN